ncbi:hypothetical protein KC344_g24 [Hortaea werneckii]|nr:hypothetical protein KC344_g24 [Hortaea werneckii]
MSFQYISSTGVLHIYHPDVRTRSVKLDEAKREEIRERAAAIAPLTAKPQGPKLHSLQFQNCPNPRGSKSERMAPQVVIDLSKEDGVDDPPRKTQASRSNGLNPSKARVDRINSGMNEMRPSYRSTSLDRRQKRPNFGDWFAPKSHAAPNSQDRPSGSSAKLSTKQSSGYGRQHDTDRASSHSNLRTVDASSSSGNVNTFLGPASDRRKPSLPTARSSNGVSPAYAQPKGAAAAPIGGSPNSIGVSNSPSNSPRVGFKRPHAEGEVSTLERLKRRKLESRADREAGRRAGNTNITSSYLQRREGQRQNAFESLGARKAALSTPRQNAPHRSKIPSSVIDLLSDEEGENGAGEDLLLSKPKFHAESSSKADNGSMKNSKSSLHTGIVKEDQKSTRNGLDASASQTATVARDSPIQDQRSGLPLETLKTSDIREVRHNRANSRKEQLNNDVTRRNNAFSDDNHYSINALASRASTSNEDGLPAASTKLEKLQQAPTPRTLEARESTQSVTEPNKRASEKPHPELLELPAYQHKAKLPLLGKMQHKKNFTTRQIGKSKQWGREPAPLNRSKSSSEDTWTKCALRTNTGIRPGSVVLVVRRP